MTSIQNARSAHGSALASVPRCVTGHLQAIHLDQSGFEETWPVFENHVILNGTGRKEIVPAQLRTKFC